MKTRKAGWYANPRCNAAIKIVNPNIIQVTNWTVGDCFIRVDTSDFSLYSCYLSPNDTRETFERELMELQIDIESLTRRKIIIDGDFNSKSTEWNSPTQDPKGVVLSEWLATMDLFVLNRGTTPTFVRGESRSFIDVTVCSQSLVCLVSRWEVLLEENLSDHNTILFEVTNGGHRPSDISGTNRCNSWRFQGEKSENFQEKITEVIESVAQNPEDTIEMLQSICDEIFTKRSTSNKRKPVYWWNAEVEDLRKECFIIKRIIVRRNGRVLRNPDEIETL